MVCSFRYAFYRDHSVDFRCVVFEEMSFTTGVGDCGDDGRCCAWQ